MSILLSQTTATHSEIVESFELTNQHRSELRVLFVYATDLSKSIERERESTLHAKDLSDPTKRVFGDRSAGIHFKCTSHKTIESKRSASMDAIQRIEWLQVVASYQNFSTSSFVCSQSVAAS